MLIPERDRMGFINGAVKNEENDSVVIGFQELLERITVIENDLSVLTIESLKLLLLEKAASSLPDKKPVIFFNSVVMDGNTKNLEFYIHGLKEKEVAKAMIPFSLYKEEDLRKCLEERKIEKKLLTILTIWHIFCLSVRRALSSVG